MVLEKTLESPLDCKEIQPVNPKGNQSWIFIGRTVADAETPILWSSDAKCQLTGKDLDAEILLKDFYPTPCPLKGFPGSAGVKNPLANTGDVGLIPGLERSRGGENNKPLQYSCLGNPMDRGAWWATVSHKESDMTEAIKQLPPKTSLTEIAWLLLAS